MSTIKTKSLRTIAPEEPTTTPIASIVAIVAARLRLFFVCCGNILNKSHKSSVPKNPAKNTKRIGTTKIPTGKLSGFVLVKNTNNANIIVTKIRRR